MTGLQITFRDGVIANVAKLVITDTYSGQLAGNMTTGTKHRLPGINEHIANQRAGTAKGTYYLEPELVSEAKLRGLTQYRARITKQHIDLGKCLKEQHLVATLHILGDKDFCHILDVHWFQTGKELAEKPLATLIQNAIGELIFEDIYDCCIHEDWLDMF